MPATTQRGGGDWEKTPGGVWTPQQSTAVSQRYERAYQRTSPELLKTGAGFYPGWHEDAEHIGQHTGLGTEAGAAIMAHLSPANEAEQNRIQALQVVHGLSDRQMGHLVKAGEHASMAKSAEVKSRSQPAGSRFHEEHAAHMEAVAQHRSKAGITGTPLGQLGSREISNAIGVLRGGGGSDPLSTLGSLKIRDFGGVIADPSSSRIPIDTHYHDLGVGRTDIPYKAKRGLESVTRYEHFQGASERARGRTSELVGRDIPHSEFMAGLWYGHQQNKVMRNPDSMKARKAADTKIGRIRSSKAAQPFLPENFGLRPSFGKISTK